MTDALNAYRFLILEGYSPENIILCGESAGGGLAYALALKLKEEKLEMPCGIIAVSPWSDLTLSGVSYDKNLENDPSMTKKTPEILCGLLYGSAGASSCIAAFRRSCKSASLLDFCRRRRNSVERF